jgi:hypothetical protein
MERAVLREREFLLFHNRRSSVLSDAPYKRKRGEKNNVVAVSQVRSTGLAVKNVSRSAIRLGGPYFWCARHVGMGSVRSLTGFDVTRDRSVSTWKLCV